MKIGMGVITMGVRPLNPNVADLKAPDTLLHVHVDSERRGVAHARNTCLRHLVDEGCEAIFLFDDDCYPLMAGWETYFVEQSVRTGLPFFGLPEAFKSRPLSLRDEVVRWDSIIGCFSFQTAAVLDRVGGYNDAYVRYGYEDAGRNNRVLRSGLCGDPNSGFPSLLRAPSYIYSEDVYARNPTPNLSVEDKAAFIEINRPTFIREVESANLYYPYG